MAPSTFASAAAGNHANLPRGESGGEWPRRTNGATQTFRRPSLATSLSSSSHLRDANSQTTATPNTGVYVPPQVSQRLSAAADNRYSRDQLIQLYQNQKESQQVGDGLASLCLGSWAPNMANGASGGLWGKRDDNVKDTQPGADVCWDRNGHALPLCTEDLTESEKELFTTSVNSPLKPPPIQTGKDGTPKEGIANRKTSVSHNQPSSGIYGLSSPTSTRPSARRRDTGDAFPIPGSGASLAGSSSRFSRDEPAAAPPPALLRRRTDFKEPGPAAESEEKEKEKEGGREPRIDTASPFGSLKRTTTGPLSAGINGPSSPWSSTSQSAGFGPMGSFGNFSISNASGHTSATPVEKRPGLGSMRGESRFKTLMTKDSVESEGKGIQEKTSTASLEKGNDASSGRDTPSRAESRPDRPTSYYVDPYRAEEGMQAGSGALGGGQDMSPPRRSGFGALGTPHRQESKDEHGFGAFGMTHDFGSLRESFHRADTMHHHTPQHQSSAGAHEAMSPANTNPYDSPENERHDPEDIDTDGSDIQHAHLPGLGGFVPDVGHQASVLPGLSGFGSVGRNHPGFEAAASDRSQTSSAGPNRGFGGLGGLPGLPGLGGGPSAAWQSGQGTIGTPSRERGFSAFGDGSFGSLAETQSPSLAGLGGGTPFSGISGSAIGSGTIGRASSKMGSLFPTAMQEQMRMAEQPRQSHEDGSIDGSDRQSATHGALSRAAFGGNATSGYGPSRDTDSPFRASRGIFDDLGANPEGVQRQGSFSSNEPIHSPFSNQLSAAGPLPGSTVSSSQPGVGQRAMPQQSQSQPQQASSSASNQPPPPQQRTMVMPDRMRWIYRDPQGNTQGPWSGLEMHDWYKAGFFSPELLVKKAEDPEFEPLAQLIRRIGNSREPFLVPQIGIPHGPPSTQPGNAWAANAGLGGGTAQPPLASSFPSFGTTLTAEQQNALERRKQEEQYLMARQKEHLVQQQALAKQMQIQGPHGMLPQQLHHHSSAHSLHSQPSFGSITSPGGFQPSPSQGPAPGGQSVPGFFDNSFRGGTMNAGVGNVSGGMDVLGSMRSTEGLSSMMDQLNLGRGGPIGIGGASGQFSQPQQQPQGQQGDQGHPQQVAAMLSDRARLQREQAQHEVAQQQFPEQMAQLHSDRLSEFNELRAQLEAENAAVAAHVGETATVEPQYPSGEFREGQRPEGDMLSTESQLKVHTGPMEDMPSVQQESMTLTEQVQKAASAKQSPAPQAPWAKIDTSVPQPFPPAQPGSPLPAPAAQRKQNVADALVAESRSRSETPSVETPSASIAPWAKETTEAPKGPSLKEIQEAEARKAAQQEEIAAAARKKAFEQEMIAASQAAQQPAPGLPSSSTWASGQSPVGGSAPQSAWTKPLAGKVTSTAPAKKTLQQIQKEEEARKQRAAAAAANAASAATTAAIAPAPSHPGGKRYADLASKTGPSATSPGAGGNASGGAWTTVGAGGKVKTPAAPIPTGPAVGMRATSGSAASKAKPSQPSRNASTAVVATGPVNAQDEFKKWAVGELKMDLSKGINADEFVSGLLNFPSDLDVITEAVHSVSQTIDSRHFAEEFIRRRKLAEKGMVDPSPSSSAAAAHASAAENKSGGWSEVAKKGPPASKEEPGNFKVVASKKKGGKR
ncbi:hypothetical protein BDY21DRAFT_386652 [Lineolata rhizophorae]|uniref:GYF domain-containing protein n=1 Tax=Lineolata rhizophorae TaxID=578093 RepID=A0A6A6NWT9_9PEZI|nr:hypothetical protein BDY21DRAFT_386652 [Lineolata rhizophorae]